MSLKDWFGLDGTTCVIAGSNGLIGRACTRALGECGARIISLDLKGASEKVDLTDAAELEAFFKKIGGEKAGKYAFINCAYPRTENWGQLGFENFTLADWNTNVSLHLGSAYHFTHLAVDFLKQRGGGSIVNFGSIYGLGGPDLGIYEGTQIKNPVAYAAIKAGITGLTRYVATAFGGQGIRANVVCPGGIENGQPASFLKAYNARTPMGRMGTPEDVAGVVAFLVGPGSKYMTGQVVAVDGGWTAW
jgi:NAD(P)-dependent dehydrogenase (short-subunit alcohol dehydrogenase family)